MVTAPGSGAEVIPFLKTLDLPMAVLFTVAYTTVRSVGRSRPSPSRCRRNPLMAADPMWPSQPLCARAPARTPAPQCTCRQHPHGAKPCIPAHQGLGRQPLDSKREAAWPECPSASLGARFG